MHIFDITQILDEHTAIYEGDPRFQREILRTIQDDGYALSKLCMGSHTGTHVDAPCHFIENGKTIADLSATRFIGPCQVVDRLIELKKGINKLLISSKNEENRLNLEQAQMLLDHGIRLVGTEGLSIGNDQVHRLLLANDCLIMEGIDLKRVVAGEYFLFAPPLKMDADGSPVRACLIRMDDE